MRTALLSLALVLTTATAAAQDAETGEPAVDSWTAFGLETGLFVAPALSVGAGYALCSNGQCDDRPALTTLVIPVFLGALVAPTLLFGELGSPDEDSQRLGWGLSGTWPGATFGFIASLGLLLATRNDLDDAGSILVLSTVPIATAIASYVLFHNLPTDHGATAVLASTWIGWFVGSMIGWVSAFAWGAGNDGQAAGLCLGGATLMLASAGVSTAIVSF